MRMRRDENDDPAVRAVVQNFMRLVSECSERARLYVPDALDPFVHVGCVVINAPGEVVYLFNDIE